MNDTIIKFALNNPEAGQRHLDYWLSRPPHERIAAVEYLRRQRWGVMPPMQKNVVKVFRREANGYLIRVK